MAYVKIRPDKSYINLENTGTSDIQIQRIVSDNAQPGQILVLDKYNRKEPGSSEGRILLISDIDPNAESDEAGNIRIPEQNTEEDVASSGFDAIEIKYVREHKSEMDKITKTLVKLMFDGEMWNVLSVTDNVHWES